MLMHVITSKWRLLIATPCRLAGDAGESALQM
jgi:hypothetical protein